MEEQIERVKETDISQSKIDTFGRYFLTYYFSQEKNQENELSKIPNYEYHLGDTVYIGADEYEIVSIDNEFVCLNGFIEIERFLLKNSLILT